jgi:hypothetical protein
LRHLVTATWDDVPHLTAKQKDDLWAGMPSHERDARSKGVPLLGSGAIFPVDEDLIKIEPFKIPDIWAQVNGLDFGYEHPFGAARLAWDRDNDIIYVIGNYRSRQTTPVFHAAAIKPWGAWIPCAWPHDGLQHDKGSGDQLAKLYRDQGLNMLPDHATWSDGSNGVEAGIAEMHDRMLTGRWKVFSTCTEWLEERRMYHRKDGKIIKERDDVISASRYGLMMLRFAIAEPFEDEDNEDDGRDSGRSRAGGY